MYDPTSVYDTAKKEFIIKYLKANLDQRELTHWESDCSICEGRGLRSDQEEKDRL